MADTYLANQLCVKRLNMSYPDKIDYRDRNRLGRANPASTDMVNFMESRIGR